MSPTTTVLEEHVSPDGQLRFVVVAHPDGDVSLGFDGFSWHTHADILAALSDQSEESAVRLFVSDLLNDRSAIALWGVPGEVRDVWISSDPDRDSCYPIEGETIELRYWSGRPWRSMQPV